MQKLQDSDWMALFCCRIRKNQLKASKLYQFRLMIPPRTRSNACCRHAERFVCSRCFVSSKWYWNRNCNHIERQFLKKRVVVRRPLEL
jgi:hypothetical protein